MSERHPTTRLRAAAWVPDDDPHRPWDDAAELAAQWIWERSDIENEPPLLVTNALASAQGIASLEDIARAGGHTTPQSRNRRFTPRPVLAYVPDPRSLRLAIDLARGHSLAIVEGSLFPLAEWAAAADAINLLTGRQSATDLDARVRKDLDLVIFFGGHNGWTGPHEKQDARRRLASHVTAGDLTGAQAASYAMAHGVSDRGAARLQQLLEPRTR